MHKVIQISFNKVATTAMHRFFVLNGIRSVHWDNGLLAQRIAERRARGEDPLADYSDDVVFSDMIYVAQDNIIEAFRYFEYFYKFYPGAYYILNTRNCDDWIGSRASHRQMIERYQEFWRVGSADEVLRRWRVDWFEHHFRVLQFFSDKNAKFLLFDIDRDKPAKIKAFLQNDFDLNLKHYGRVNRTKKPRWSLGRLIGQ